MYKLHLILKYLRKRRIAWVSLIAVTLCTAMVIVVISVMGGWLRMFKESFRGLSGDIIVHGESLVGFPHYQEMVARIEKLPEVKAAVPTIETFGLININNVRRRGVQVIGYPIDKIGQVNDFVKSLYRQYERLSEAERKTVRPSFDKPLPPETYRAILPRARGDVSQWPGMIVGSGVVGIGKNAQGIIERSDELYYSWVKLTVLAVSPDSASLDIAGDKGERNYWIVDDSRTKVWQYDYSTVYVPFDVLQKDLRMDQQTIRDPVTGQQEILPARTRDIQISIKPGADLAAVKQQVQKIVDEVSQQQGISERFPIAVMTWLESQATFINAIEKEKALVTFLFAMISVVAIFLIFCIFYMIVVEKTRDIGIIKSVGATSAGVAGIFLGYGLAIGLLGSLLGLLFGYLIVHNINYLHEQMGRVLGIQIWNPEVYAFDIIPNTLNPPEVIVIMAVAILSSVLGALVPALRAASLHPVEALRWE